jgi:hypothetical protein
MEKQSADAPRSPRGYEEPTIVAIGALHELTLTKDRGGSDFLSQTEHFPSGTY